MNVDSKRAVIAAVRRAAFAGLILLIIWAMLFGLRSAIPKDNIDLINQQVSQSGIKVSYDSSTWDWTKSLFRDTPVSQEIGKRMPVTLQIIVLAVLFSLILTAVMLLFGVLISLITVRPAWLSRIRSILRLILVSRGAAIPAFAISTYLVVFTAVHYSWSPPMQYSFSSLLLPAFFCALPVTWLLVQEGHGIIMNRTENILSPPLAQDIAVRLIIRLLKLVGAIIVITIPAEQIFVQPGMGRLILQAANMRDYPLMFGIVWILVVIVVLVKLVAEFIEITYNHLTRKNIPTASFSEKPVLRTLIPKGWLIFSLALAIFIVLAALIGPFLAPYGMNEIHLIDRLSPPSSNYLLGTDQLGRDILSRLLYGIRTDVSTGLICAVVLSIIGTGWAILAAFCRKMNNSLGDTLEDLVMLPRDIGCAFPWLVLGLLIMSLTGTGVTLVAIACGLVMLPHALGMMQEAYRSPPQGKDWLQSVVLAIPVVFIFIIAGSVLYITNLSFLGFGVPPGIAELGSILSAEGRQFMQAAPHLAYWPTYCLVLIMLVLVMAGDALLERLGYRSKAVWLKTME